MIDFKETTLSNCIVHKVDNKVRKGNIKLSDSEIALDDELSKQLTQFFLKPFRGLNDTYCFYHDIDLKMNEVFTCADNIFENENFVKNSKSIAKHLYEQTRHPSIKDGEVFIALLGDVIFEKTIGKAIGIFKSESKDNFFKLKESNKGIQLIIDKGISQQRIDKGCLILHDDYHKGFKVFTYEHGGADTDYWRNDFLSIKSREDNYFLTKNYLSLCREFSVNVPDEFELNKVEKIDLLNRSIEYFKANDKFEKKEFEKSVIADKELIKSFRKYDVVFNESNGFKLMDAFDISSLAVKKQTKVFKSILKLDKNFHIYIHGNKELIERGYDKSKDMNYYKVYFNNEE
jgi:hypothetical protein